MTRKINAKGLALIKSFEGLRLKAYQCSANVWTIGYGHTGSVAPNMVIPEPRAEELLREDLDKFEKGVFRLTTGVELTDNEFSALISFAFNIGLFAFEKSTLRKVLSNPKKAADEFLKWNKVGNKISLGLTRRREAERALFLDKS